MNDDDDDIILSDRRSHAYDTLPFDDEERRKQSRSPSPEPHENGVNGGHLPLRSPLGNNALARQSLPDIAGVANGHDHDDQDPEQGFIPGSGAPKQESIGDKGGMILGIHNIFIVIPQFLVSGLSGLIFWLYEPEKSILHGKHPGTISPGSTMEKIGMRAEMADEDNNPNSLGLIFRYVEILSPAPDRAHQTS